MFGIVLSLVALALLVGVACIWKSKFGDTSNGLICSIVLGGFGVIAASVVIGYYAAPWFVAIVGVIGVVLFALAILAIVGAGVLPTDFGLVMFAIILIVAVIILIFPMVTTSFIVNGDVVLANIPFLH